VDTMVPAMVGAEVAAAEEDTLLLMVQSRMQRRIPGLPSCAAQFPQL
jgi:hypothetical protein